MMKQILFVLFSTFFSGQAKIIAENNISLFKEGDPITLLCDKPLAKWTYRGNILADCQNCPSACKVYDLFDESDEIPDTNSAERGITAFCDGENSILRFDSAETDFNYGKLRCQDSDSEDFQYCVGRYDGNIHLEKYSPVALDQKDFTLIYYPIYYGPDNYIGWYNGQAEIISHCKFQCVYNITDYDEKQFQMKTWGNLLIKNVSVKDDGKIFASVSIQSYYGYSDGVPQCMEGDRISIFKLTVNVPIKSVSIESRSQVFVENQVGIFICKVGVSKPSASFKWFIVYQDGFSEEIQPDFTTICTTSTEKIWQTNSTLKLKLNRNFHKIMCKATIGDLTWTDSEYLLLDIQSEGTNFHIAAILTAIIVFAGIIGWIIFFIKYSEKVPKSIMANNLRSSKGHKLKAD